MVRDPMWKLVEWWQQLTERLPLDKDWLKLIRLIGPMAAVSAIAAAFCFLLMLLYRGVRKGFVKALVYLAAIVSVISALLWRFMWVETVGYAPYGTTEEVIFAAPVVLVTLFCLWMIRLCRNREAAARKKLEREQAAAQRRAEAEQRAQDEAAQAEQRRSESAQRRAELMAQAAQFMKPLDEQEQASAVQDHVSEPLCVGAAPVVPVATSEAAFDDLELLRRLKQMHELKKAGLVTDEEFEQKKQALIRQL